jgi:hypothetical protein
MRTLSLRSLFVVLTSLGVLTAVACSSQEALPPPGPGNAGGAGGQTSDDSAALAAELCPGACDTAKTCYAALDLGACKAQCGEELAGRGYFVREFAVPYFQKLNEIDEDKSCGVTESFVPWGRQPPTYDNVPEVAQAEILNECSAPYQACTGSSFAIGCFLGFYIFNETRRDAIRPCFGLACWEMDNCMGSNQPDGAPWVAIPPHDGGFLH